PRAAFQRRSGSGNGVVGPQGPALGRGRRDAHRVCGPGDRQRNLPGHGGSSAVLADGAKRTQRVRARPTGRYASRAGVEIFLARVLLRESRPFTRTRVDGNVGLLLYPDSSWGTS